MSGSSYTAEFWQYDARLGRRWNIDPVVKIHESPYAAFADNPIIFADPNGDSPDNVIVNDDGVVTDVERNDDPNKFFDEDGTEFNFNDPDNLDEMLSTDDFNKGDQLYFPVSKEQIGKTIANAGMDPLFEKATSKYFDAVYSVVTKSHGSADFVFSFLSTEFPINRAGSDNETVLRAGFSESAGYFRFGESNTVFNLYDAGNFLWGTWMKLNNYSDFTAKYGAHLNEILHGNFKGDSDADQRAIGQGLQLKF